MTFHTCPSCGQPIHAGRIEASGVILNPATRTIWVRSKAHKAPSQVFDLIYFLARHPGFIRDRNAIRAELDMHDGLSERAPDHAIKRARKWLADRGRPGLIRTRYGEGFFWSGKP